MRLVVLALARVEDQNTQNWMWDVVLHPKSIEDHAVLTSSLEASTAEPEVAATTAAAATDSPAERPLSRD